MQEIWGGEEGIQTRRVRPSSSKYTGIKRLLSSSSRCKQCTRGYKMADSVSRRTLLRILGIVTCGQNSVIVTERTGCGDLMEASQAVGSFQCVKPRELLPVCEHANFTKLRDLPRNGNQPTPNASFGQVRLLATSTIALLGPAERLAFLL
jgi:hypothetical protein